MQTGRLLPITVHFACGSMVRFYLFPENLAQRAKFSGKSMSYSALPEANRAGCPGRRLPGQRLRNSCLLHRLCGGRIHRTCTPTTSVFACGSMVLFYLFTKNFTKWNFLWKDLVSFALPEAISPAKCGMLDTYQHWSFRGFRSCRVVRGPNCHRV